MWLNLILFLVIVSGLVLVLFIILCGFESVFILFCIVLRFLNKWVNFYIIYCDKFLICNVKVVEVVIVFVFISFCD